MGLSFEFTTSSRIIFGRGSALKLSDLICGKGKRVFLVTGRNADRFRFVRDRLVNEGFEVSLFSVESEPTTEIISDGVEIARQNNCDVVIGIGGGSVIDSAKAIAALIPNEGSLTNYLEVIGEGRILESNPLPYIALPTTSGTGAEVTKNAVIKSLENRVKVSLRSPLMFPDVAIVDPELAVSMPPEITASSGMDALTHLFETFVSSQSNPFIDALCREGMQRISSSLKKAFIDGNDVKAREDMAFASMLGGMALANVKLGAVHGFAGPMGGMFPVSHGFVCAALLPAVTEVNLKVISEKKLERYLSKLDEAARIFTGNPEAKAQDGIHWIKELVEYLKIPFLSEFNIDKDEFPLIVQKAKKASSMKGNPVLLSDEDLMEILERSF
jgi:alcohol dehydrogenase class IV